MKIYMTRGVFYRDETNENDVGEDWTMGSVREVPDPPSDNSPKEPSYATKFALGLLSQGRARKATAEDVAEAEAKPAKAAK